MRSRNIKPGFFKNDLLAECDPLARILFAGMWCMADRAGRLEYRKKKIKVELLPYDDCDISILVDQLSRGRFIEVYSVNEKHYIEIKNFARHQNPHHREAESTIPPPLKPQTSPGPAPDKPQASPEPAVLIPDSLNLIPDSKEKQRANPVPQSVDNPPPPDPPEKKQLYDLFLKISKEFPDPSQLREVQLFIELNRRNGNPKALAYSLNRLLEEKARGKPPVIIGKWLEKVMLEENKNHNARDAEAETAGYKQDFTSLEDIFRRMPR